MTPAERLLAYFDRISEAPDAIPRLRRFVLDLAVRGKLVDQDARDEPAAKLLARIQDQKAIEAKPVGAKKRSYATLESEPIEAPFRLPGGWLWTTLAHVGYISPRNAASDDHPASFVPMALIPADYGSHVKHEETIWREIKGGYTHFANGDVALAKITPCFENGKSAVFRDLLGGIGAGTTELHVIRPIGVDSDFLLIFLKSPYFIESGIPKMTGTAGQKRVPLDYFANAALPLPPLAEQHRIVAKVDELMVLCDRLEAAQTERQNRHDRLLSASLTRLTQQADSASFHERAGFILQRLPSMFAAPSDVDRLRRAIVDLAIRGHLVEPGPDDQPASTILEYIAQRRTALHREGVVPKPRLLPRIDEGEKPFALPEGWAWGRLGDLCYRVADGPHFSPKYVSRTDGIPFLSTRNVRRNGFDLTSLKYVSRADHEEFCRRIRPEKGDIIYTKGGTTGIAKVNDLDFDFSVWVHLAVLRLEKEKLFPRFVELALNSPHCYEQSQTYTQGISNFDLGLTRMVKITIPLPPLNEQYRIVAKVDELTALCDRIEARLEAGRAAQAALLEATLREALADGATPASATASA